jgi:hypothetical protein
MGGKGTFKKLVRSVSFQRGVWGYRAGVRVLGLGLGEQEVQRRMGLEVVGRFLGHQSTPGHGFPRPSPAFWRRRVRPLAGLCSYTDVGFTVVERALLLLFVVWWGPNWRT